MYVKPRQGQAGVVDRRYKAAKHQKPSSSQQKWTWRGTGYNVTLAKWMEDVGGGGVWALKRGAGGAKEPYCMWLQGGAR